jgi:hypothetical protein
MIIRMIRASFIVIALCYSSTLFFVYTGSSKDVKNYCHKGIMRGESVLSQRNVACNFSKNVNYLKGEAHGLYNRLRGQIQSK